MNAGGDEIRFSHTAPSLPWVIPVSESGKKLKWNLPSDGRVGYALTKVGSSCAKGGANLVELKVEGVPTYGNKDVKFVLTNTRGPAFRESYWILVNSKSGKIDFLGCPVWVDSFMSSIILGPFRTAFGKTVAEQGVVRDWIAESRWRIEQARLLVLRTAWLIEKIGNRAARTEISAIKVVAPQTALWVIDKAIQVHGGAGVSDDTPLARMWAMARTLRIADGPDEVHNMVVARRELGRY